MILQRKIAFVVKQPVQHIGCVPIGTLHWNAVEWGIVIGNKGIEFQSKVSELGAVCLLGNLAF